MGGYHWGTGYWREPKRLNVYTVPHAILDSSKKVIAIRNYPPRQPGQPYDANVVAIPSDLKVAPGWTWTGRFFCPPSKD